jgi:threonine/homoserine/homoserine lactone efflux protein
VDDIWWLLKGFAIGLAVAIPVGPIALLCMRRTLQGGFTVGFATGLGAAVADLFYVALAVFGISEIEAILVRYRTGLSFAGGVFLLVMAARTAMCKTKIVCEVDDSASGFVSALASGFVLTATNPLTVLGFVAIFAGLGVGEGLTDRSRGVLLVLGVLAGSTVWWLTLTAIVVRVRHFFSSRTLQAFNLTAAALIAAFGIYELIVALTMAAPWLF